MQTSLSQCRSICWSPDQTSNRNTTCYVVVVYIGGETDGYEMQLYWRKWTESWEENSMGKDKKVAGTETLRRQDAKGLEQELKRKPLRC